MFGNSSFHYKLILSYDGTSYFGWQKTKTGPSIQESLEKALWQMTGETQIPEGASRTDRGVHAEGQVASICLAKRWELRQLQRGINALLPEEIRILHVEEAPFGFHPTLQALEKEYHYRLCLGAVQSPIYRLYSWAFPFPLDLERMERASQDLLGAHDFSAFANGASKRPICTLNKVALTQLPEARLQIAICGDRFLYKMARNITGTLVYIGCGKLPADCIPQIFHDKDRKQAGIAAPAHGLALFRVRYPLL